MRVNYIDLNPEAVNLILSISKNVPSIDTELKALVELRVSQINGCAYCIDLHSNDARMGKIAQQKLDCLSVFKECQLFTDREVAALSWAEGITNIAIEKDIENKLNGLIPFFNQEEIVDLTLIVALMNTLNRLSISFGDKPISRE